MREIGDRALVSEFGVGESLHSGFRIEYKDYEN